MLAGGGVGPLAGGALAVVRAAQADEQAAAPACWRHRRPASSDPPDGRWRDSDGTPPRRCARGGGPGPRRATAWLPPHAAPVGDADERVALHQCGEDRRTAGAGRHEQAQLPGDDLGDQPHRLQAIDHALGEAAELDPEQAHHLGAAEAAAHPASSRIVRPSRTADQASAGAMLTPSALTACATQAGETSRPMTRSPASVCRR